MTLFTELITCPRSDGTGLSRHLSHILRGQDGTGTPKTASDLRRHLSHFPTGQPGTAPSATCPLSPPLYSGDRLGQGVGRGVLGATKPQSLHRQMGRLSAPRAELARVIANKCTHGITTRGVCRECQPTETEETNDE